MPTMPTGLRPVVSDYSVTGPAGVLRTDVAGGRPRYGLDWDRGVQQFRVALVLNSLEFSVWSTFYHLVIKKGAIAFDMHLDSGYGPQLHTVNIVPDSYSYTRKGGAMTVATFVVEAESAAYGISAADGAALLAFYEATAPYGDTLLARIAAFANGDTLVLT